jgi:aryl-alcohol dehydrogenase-like predicted oxidoreductase
MSRATPEGTARFAQRHAAATSADHWRRLDGLTLSSVGLGTYLGAPDDAADRRYVAAVERAIALGINVLDTAINYRHQRSERAVGRAIAGAPREELVIATKGGFLPLPARELADVARADEIVAGCHCIAPRYLADQIARSRRNLGIETIDIYYLHNPEMQLEEVTHDVFAQRVRAAFEVLEQARADGAIVRYGAATWNGFRTPGQLDLDALLQIAREVGGDDHGFRVVQLPLNRSMPEAAQTATQRGRTLLAAAKEHGVYVMSSASILQGKLARDPAEARASIAWVRGQDGLGTALVGMGRPEHVEANAAAFRP